MDGERALRMLAEPVFKPNLIILDLKIPKVPGIAILAQCKPPAPVVVFSSSSNPAEIQRAKELGVRKFVHKPIDFDAFDRVVRRMIHRIRHSHKDFDNINSPLETEDYRQGIRSKLLTRGFSRIARFSLFSTCYDLLVPKEPTAQPMLLLVMLLLIPIAVWGYFLFYRLGG